MDPKDIPLELESSHLVRSKKRWFDYGGYRERSSRPAKKWGGNFVVEGES
jgi:hypothetical protein